MKTDFVFRDLETPTGCAMIFVETTLGQNMIVIDSGSNEKITEEEIDQAMDVISRSDLVLFQFENNLEIIRKAMNVAVDNGVPICLNPAPAIVPFPMDLIPLLTILAPNEIEAESIVGFPIDSIEAAQQATQQMVELGVKCAIITLGEKGVVASTIEETITVPSFLRSCDRYNGSRGFIYGCLCRGLG